MKTSFLIFALLAELVSCSYGAEMTHIDLTRFARDRENAIYSGSPIASLQGRDLRDSFLGRDLIRELRSTGSIMVDASGGGATRKAQSVYSLRLTERKVSAVVAELLRTLQLDPHRGFPECVVVRSALIERNTPSYFLRNDTELSPGDAIILMDFAPVRVPAEEVRSVPPTR